MSASTKTQPGYIYILTNRSMPGLVKIGKTKRSPETRAIEVSRGTGIPTPFVVSYQRKVSDMDRAEREAHDRLDAVRRNKRREFFEVDLSKATRIVDKVCDRYPVNKRADGTDGDEGGQFTPFLNIVRLVAIPFLFVWDWMMILTLIGKINDTTLDLNQFSSEHGVSLGITAGLLFFAILIGKRGQKRKAIVRVLLITFLIAYGISIALALI